MNRKFFIGAALALAFGGGLLGALDRANGNMLQGGFGAVPGATWSLIAFGTNAGSAATTTTVSGLTTTTADMLVVCGSANGTTPVFTDNHGAGNVNTWTAFNAGVNAKARCAYTATTPTVFSGGHNFVQTGVQFTPLIVFAFKGSSSATTPPLDSSASSGLDSGPTSTIQAGSITPTQANELVLAIDAVDASGSPVSIASSPAYGSIVIVSGVLGTTLGLGVAFLAQTTAAATNPTWTNSGSIASTAIIQSFKHS